MLTRLWCLWYTAKQSPSRRFNFGRIIFTMSLGQYLKDTKAEVQHVSWPTQRQAIVFTVFVVAFSLVIALLLGLADFLFTKGLSWFVS